MNSITEYPVNEEVIRLRLSGKAIGRVRRLENGTRRILYSIEDLVIVPHHECGPSTGSANPTSEVGQGQTDGRPSSMEASVSIEESNDSNERDSTEEVRHLEFLIEHILNSSSSSRGHVLSAENTLPIHQDTNGSTHPAVTNTNLSHSAERREGRRFESVPRRAEQRVASRDSKRKLPEWFRVDHCNTMTKNEKKNVSEQNVATRNVKSSIKGASSAVEFSRENRGFNIDRPSRQAVSDMVLPGSATWRPPPVQNNYQPIPRSALTLRRSVSAMAGSQPHRSKLLEQSAFERDESYEIQNRSGSNVDREINRNSANVVSECKTDEIGLQDTRPTTVQHDSTRPPKPKPRRRNSVQPGSPKEGSHDHAQEVRRISPSRRVVSLDRLNIPSPSRRNLDRRMSMDALLTKTGKGFEDQRRVLPDQAEMSRGEVRRPISQLDTSAMSRRLASDIRTRMNRISQSCTNPRIFQPYTNPVSPGKCRYEVQGTESGDHSDIIVPQRKRSAASADKQKDFCQVQATKIRSRLMSNLNQRIISSVPESRQQQQDQTSAAEFSKSKERDMVVPCGHENISRSRNNNSHHTGSNMEKIPRKACHVLVEVECLESVEPIPLTREVAVTASRYPDVTRINPSSELHVIAPRIVDNTRVHDTEGFPTRAVRGCGYIDHSRQGKVREEGNSGKHKTIAESNTSVNSLSSSTISNPIPANRRSKNSNVGMSQTSNACLESTASRREARERHTYVVPLPLVPSPRISSPRVPSPLLPPPRVPSPRAMSPRVQFPRVQDPRIIPSGRCVRNTAEVLIGSPTSPESIGHSVSDTGPGNPGPMDKPCHHSDSHRPAPTCHVYIVQGHCCEGMEVEQTQRDETNETRWRISLAPGGRTVSNNISNNTGHTYNETMEASVTRAPNHTQCNTASTWNQTNSNMASSSIEANSNISSSSNQSNSTTASIWNQVNSNTASSSNQENKNAELGSNQTNSNIVSRLKQESSDTANRPILNHIDHTAASSSNNNIRRIATGSCSNIRNGSHNASNEPRIIVRTSAPLTSLARSNEPPVASVRRNMTHRRSSEHIVPVIEEGRTKTNYTNNGKRRENEDHEEDPESEFQSEADESECEEQSGTDDTENEKQSISSNSDTEKREEESNYSESSGSSNSSGSESNKTSDPESNLQVIPAARTTTGAVQVRFPHPRDLALRTRTDPVPVNFFPTAAISYDIRTQPRDVIQTADLSYLSAVLGDFDLQVELDAMMVSDTALIQEIDRELADYERYLADTADYFNEIR